MKEKHNYSPECEKNENKIVYCSENEKNIIYLIEFHEVKLIALYFEVIFFSIKASVSTR